MDLSGPTTSGPLEPMDPLVLEAELLEPRHGSARVGNAEDGDHLVGHTHIVAPDGITLPRDAYIALYRQLETSSPPEARACG